MRRGPAGPGNGEQPDFDRRHFNVYGTANLGFNGDAVLTGSRSITVFDPAQTTAFNGNFGEAVNSGVTSAALTKLGRGTVTLSPTAGKSVSYTGNTQIGASNQDGGTLKLPAMRPCR